MTVDDPFVARYLSTGMKLAERHGFAVPPTPGRVLDDASRKRLVENRSVRAVAAITDLQQWLADDSPEVRRAARHAIDTALQAALAGGYAGPTAARGTWDPSGGVLWRLRSRRERPDQREPWWITPGGARTLRRLGILTTVATAIAASATVALGHTVWVLGLMAVGALVDVLEGALGRLVATSGSRLRWLSCVGSHVTDLVLLSGVVVAEQRLGHGGTGLLLAGSMVVTLLASLMRVSALQTGYAFWRSRLERVVRWSAVVAYVLAAAAGVPQVGAVTAVVLVASYAVFEIGRVLRRVARGSAREGRLVFRAADKTVLSLSLADDYDVVRRIRPAERPDGDDGRPGPHPHHSSAHRR